MFQKLTMRGGDIYDMPGCKHCGFGGVLEDGRKIFFWNSRIKSLDFGKDPEIIHMGENRK